MTIQNRPISVFISHSNADTPFARRLAKGLVANGIRVWLDVDEIHVGDSLVETIERGISESDAMLTIVSANQGSKWSQYELNSLVTRDPATDQPKPVIPILLEHAEIPLALRAKKGVDFRRDFDEALRELIEGLRRRFPDAPPYTPKKRPLPHLSTHFVGREREMHQLQSLLANHVAVLVVGFGGIGKTTLAIQFAHWVQRTDFAEDIVWTSWQSLTEAAFLADLEQQLSVTVESISQDARVDARVEQLGQPDGEIALTEGCSQDDP